MQNVFNPNTMKDHELYQFGAESLANQYYDVLIAWPNRFGIYGDLPDRHERAVKISSDMAVDQDHKFRKKADILIPLLTPKRF